MECPQFNLTGLQNIKKHRYHIFLTHLARTNRWTNSKQMVSTKSVLPVGFVRSLQLILVVVFCLRVKYLQ